jgi:hypothetical protein
MTVKDRNKVYEDPETDPYAKKSLRYETVEIEPNEHIIAVQMDVHDKGYPIQLRLKMVDELWLK